MFSIKQKLASIYEKTINKIQGEETYISSPEGFYEDMDRRLAAQGLSARLLSSSVAGLLQQIIKDDQYPTTFISGYIDYLSRNGRILKYSSEIKVMYNPVRGQGDEKTRLIAFLDKVLGYPSAPEFLLVSRSYK
ncbi:MAG: hypothetical protein MUC97_01955 [Bernardetiaceae bacterium]|jgi:hypothetical protein|nr:hypothetical protein [Bernardetiaceae bacterium]